MINKTQYKWALSSGHIVIVGTKFTTNGWTHFKVYRLQNNELHRIDLETATYWNKRTLDYQCNAWGTDRRLEIILAIGYELGLEFGEMKQNYKWLQD